MGAVLIDGFETEKGLSLEPRRAGRIPAEYGGNKPGECIRVILDIGDTLIKRDETREGLGF
jgi:hypothetical protein